MKHKREASFCLEALNAGCHFSLPMAEWGCKALWSLAKGKRQGMSFNRPAPDTRLRCARHRSIVESKKLALEAGQLKLLPTILTLSGTMEEEQKSVQPKATEENI